MSRQVFLFLLNLLIAGPLIAAELHIAVASNFTEPARLLAAQFETQTAHKVKLSSGSTGKHYAQIKHGAPFDIFLAADAIRPQRLEQEGLAIPGSRFTYAIGKLVLWSAQPDYVDAQGKVLTQGTFRYLAIANPRLAPYGVAAQEVLQHFGLWDSLQDRLVRGENINQTFQFVRSGNASLGFVAYAQVMHPDLEAGGSLWVVPPHLYTPIRQQAVVLRDSPAAQSFVKYMRSDAAFRILREFGYDADQN